MRMRSFSEAEAPVSGRKLGLSFMASISAAVGVGAFSYYGLVKTMAVRYP